LSSFLYVRPLTGQGISDPRPSLLHPYPSCRNNTETYCKNQKFESLVWRSVCFGNLMVF
jgi:hypothetical protein